MRKLVLFVLTLCLGAVAYSLLRTEQQERVPEEGAPGPGERPPGRSAEPGAAAPPATCAAKTRSGKPCTRAAEPGSRFCWQHG